MLFVDRVDYHFADLSGHWARLGGHVSASRRTAGMRPRNGMIRGKSGRNKGYAIRHSHVGTSRERRTPMTTKIARSSPCGRLYSDENIAGFENSRWRTVRSQIVASLRPDVHRGRRGKEALELIGRSSLFR